MGIILSKGVHEAFCEDELGAYIREHSQFSLGLFLGEEQQIVARFPIDVFKKKDCFVSGYDQRIFSTDTVGEVILDMNYIIGLHSGVDYHERLEIALSEKNSLITTNKFRRAIRTFNKASEIESLIDYIKEPIVAKCLEHFSNRGRQYLVPCFVRPVDMLASPYEEIDISDAISGLPTTEELYLRRDIGAPLLIVRSGTLAQHCNQDYVYAKNRRFGNVPKGLPAPKRLAETVSGEVLAEFSEAAGKLEKNRTEIDFSYRVR
ncbi:hypothetical protein HOA92_04960 [archaeon]|jgi:hypothetical protein|nr:hypothetical protein [archaeon]MBT6762368.1 hypothetical protein [archaeon]